MSPIAGYIAREQREPLDGRVRSDIEVRKQRGPLAAPSAIVQEALVGKESGFLRQGFPLVRSEGQSGIEGFNGAEFNRHLGVDHRIDNQGGAVGPSCVAGSYVQKNVAVDEDATAIA